MIKIMHKRVTAVTIHMIPIAEQRLDATAKVEDPDGHTTGEKYVRLERMIIPE